MPLRGSSGEDHRSWSRDTKAARRRCEGCHRLVRGLLLLSERRLLLLVGACVVGGYRRNWRRWRRWRWCQQIVEQRKVMVGFVQVRLLCHVGSGQRLLR